MARQLIANNYKDSKGRIGTLYINPMTYSYIVGTSEIQMKVETLLLDETPELGGVLLEKDLKIYNIGFPDLAYFGGAISFGPGNIESSFQQLPFDLFYAYFKQICINSVDSNPKIVKSTVDGKEVITEYKRGLFGLSMIDFDIN